MKKVELAKEFSRIVRRELSEHIDEINAKNQVDDFHCATHEYCDSNVLMEEAFKNTLGRDLKLTHKDLSLVSSAWTLAASKDFYVLDAQLEESLAASKK